MAQQQLVCRTVKPPLNGTRAPCSAYLVPSVIPPAGFPGTAEKKDKKYTPALPTPNVPLVRPVPRKTKTKAAQAAALHAARGNRTLLCSAQFHPLVKTFGALTREASVCRRGNEGA